MKSTSVMLSLLVLFAGSLFANAARTAPSAHTAIVSAIADLCLDTYDSSSTSKSTCAMLELVSACDVEPAVSATDGRTIFVPADSAFSNAELDFLKGDRDVACAIVQYHTVQGVHLAFGESDVELTSTYIGAPVFVNKFQKTYYLNMNSFVSGSRTTPPRILASRLADNVVVHVIDAVATPFISKDDFDRLAAENSKKHKHHKHHKSYGLYVGGYGLSVNPFQPGFDTGVANAGPQFYTRNAFGQAYNPFTAIWLNLYAGYSSNPALYCQSIRCKGPGGAERVVVEDPIVVVVEAPAPEPEAEIAPDSIAGTAIATPILSSLVAAVLAVPGLVDLLVNPEDTLTVLAPTDDAFAALFDTLGVTSVDEIPTETLLQVLSYHLIPGDAVTSPELFDGAVFTTAEGDDLTVSIEADGTIDFVGIGSTAAVVLPDVVAGNSIVHVIDTVLLPFELPSAPAPAPEAEPSIADVAIETPDLSILVEALIAADFVAPLSEPDAELTVFAPINSAFVAVLEVLGLEALSDIPLPTLETVLAYHVVDGAFDEAAIAELAADGEPLNTLIDVPLALAVDDGGAISIEAVGSTATVLLTLEVGNSVVYVLDTVLLPIEAP